MSLKLNHAEVCGLLGIKAPTLASYRREGMPVMTPGTKGVPAEYDGEAIVKWLLDREIRSVVRKYEKQGPAGTGRPLNAAVEKARESKERADKYALDNAVRRGELVELATVKESWMTRIYACKNRLLGIPTKAAPLVLGCRNMRETQQVIEGLVDDALQQLHAEDGV